MLEKHTVTPVLPEGEFSGFNFGACHSQVILMRRIRCALALISFARDRDTWSNDYSLKLMELGRSILSDSVNKIDPLLGCHPRPNEGDAREGDD